MNEPTEVPSVELSIVDVRTETYVCEHCENPITDLYVRVDKSWVCRLTLHMGPDPELSDWFKRAIPAFLALHKILEEKNCLVPVDDEEFNSPDEPLGGVHNVH